MVVKWSKYCQNMARMAKKYESKMTLEWSKMKEDIMST